MVFVDELTAAGFFSTGTWTVVRNIALAVVALFWLALALWVYKDARRRIADPWLVGLATLIGLVPPFIGPLIYLLLRPPEYLEEARERELEIRAMEQRLSGRDVHCPVCRAQVDTTFLVCPVCTTRLRQPCVNCKAPLEAVWQVCPYCETPVETPPAPEFGRTQLLEPRRRRERRRAE